MSDSQKTISFQGALGANSDMACRDAFPDMKPLPCRTFSEAFAAVRDGDADLSMIPIENSVAGRVADIHHLLPESGLKIIGEYFLRINFHLFAVPGAALEDITHVHSHIHALPQCSKFIAKHGFEPVVHVDTAGAAADVAKWGDKTQASISTELAGSMYKLNNLARDLEDADHNTTRFVVMSREQQIPDPGQPDLITTFVFRVRSLPAALYKAMGGFATNGVNITKLESYLSGDFVVAQFYADVEGHPEDEGLKNALEELRFFTTSVDMLGTYPAHEYRIEQMGRIGD
jgi:prephenate dehydratase